MRFASYLLAALSSSSLVYGSALGSKTSTHNAERGLDLTPAGTTSPYHNGGLQARSFVDLCAHVVLDLKVGGIFFGHIDICLCLSLLPTFLKQNAVAQKAVKVYGERAVADYFTNYVNSLPHSSCQYPEHSVPVCSANCDFTCKPPYVKYGNACVLPPSQRKRSPVELERDEDKCAFGLTKCGVFSSSSTSPSSSKKSATPYECLDVRDNLESCGGCVIPFLTPLASPSGPKGVDCTSLPGVTDVACQRGTCVVRRCRKGYSLLAKNGSTDPSELECVANDSTLRIMSGDY